jgi:hypothetical protein
VFWPHVQLHPKYEKEIIIRKPVMNAQPNFGTRHGSPRTPS